MRTERLVGKIISRVLDLNHVADECQTFRNTLETSDEESYQTVARIVPDSDLFVVFSIPNRNRTIFITVTDGDVSLVRQVLSNLDEFELECHQLRINDVVIFDNQALSEYGIAAVTLLPVSVSGILCDLEDVMFDGSKYHFSLVVFMSRTELEIWKQGGAENLMLHYDQHDMISTTKTCSLFAKPAEQLSANGSALCGPCKGRSENSDWPCWPYRHYRSSTELKSDFAQIESARADLERLSEAK